MRIQALKLAIDNRYLTETLCPRCGAVMRLAEAETSPSPPRLSRTFICTRCDTVSVVTENPRV